MRVRRPYRTDVSDARWALIEPVFTAWRARRTGPGTAARVHDLREIVNAILYVNRTGIPWEYLPHDFPPYKTVYDYHAKWEADGTTQQVHDLFHGDDLALEALGDIDSCLCRVKPPLRSPNAAWIAGDLGSRRTGSPGRAARPAGPSAPP